MNDTFLPGSGFDTYESQDKVLMQMDGSTEAAVAVRILQQQGFAVVGAVVRLAPEQAEAAQRAKKAAEALGIECILLNAEALAAAGSRRGLAAVRRPAHRRRQAGHPVHRQQQPRPAGGGHRRRAHRAAPGGRCPR